MRVYVARHGETTWNLAGRYQGRRESALTALGMSQAFALAEAMVAADVTCVVSSPLLRCTATAKVSADRLNLRVERDDRLIEVAHGTWEGRLREEIAANDPFRYRAWRHDPANVAFEDGESIARVLERWRGFAESLCPRAPTLVVTHDAVARVALVAARGGDLSAFWEAQVENGGFATFEVDADRWTLVAECCTAHLGTRRASTETQAL